VEFFSNILHYLSTDSDRMYKNFRKTSEILDGRASEIVGVWKIGIFDQYLALFRQ